MEWSKPGFLVLDHFLEFAQTHVHWVGDAIKGPYSQSYGFSSSHVWMWELDHKEGWVAKNWYFQTVVLKKTLESPLDSKEIKPVNPKEKSILNIYRWTDAEAPILWPPDGKSWLIRKNLDAGKDWRQKEKKVAENDKQLDSITDSMDMNLSKLWEIVKSRGAWHAAVHGVTKSQTRLSNWTTRFLKIMYLLNVMSYINWFSNAKPIFHS